MPTLSPFPAITQNSHGQLEPSLSAELDELDGIELSDNLEAEIEDLLAEQ